MALSQRDSARILNGTNRVDVIKENIAKKIPTKVQTMSAPVNSNSSVSSLSSNTPVYSNNSISNRSGSPSGGESLSIKSSYDPDAYYQKIQTNINSMYDNQTQARLAQLRASQQKALGQINQQKAEVAPQYADKRNQSDVASSQNAQKLRELMASNGLQSSGENVTANVGLQNARQNALNGLNLQEQQTMNDFNRQINDATDPNQEQALRSDLEYQRAQALTNLDFRSDDRAYQVSRDTVADNQWNQQFNYQTGRDSVADNQWNTQFNYQQGRDTVGDNQWQQQFDTSNNQWNQQFDYGKTRDAVGDQQWQTSFDEQKRLADYNNYRRQYEYNNLSASEKEQKRLADYNNYRRQYEYNNMSKSEQASMDWAIKQYGEDSAWRMYEMEYNGNLALSQNQAEIDAYSGNALDFLP